MSWFSSERISKKRTDKISEENQLQHHGDITSSAEYRELFGSTHQDDNDAHYEHELAELGFERESEPKINNNVVNISNIATMLSTLGVIDESKISVDDSDMSNPEFLAALDTLGNNEESQNAYTHDVKDPPSVNIPPVTNSLEVEENLVDKIKRLKWEAQQLNRQGKRQEAIDTMRAAKILETHGGAERRVDKVHIISKNRQENIDSSSSTSQNRIAPVTIPIESNVVVAETSKAAYSSVAGPKKVNDPLKLAPPQPTYTTKNLTSTSTIPSSQRNNDIKVNASSSTFFSPTKYIELEANLKEAKKIAFEEAKRFKVICPSEAADQMRLLKRYNEELSTIESNLQSTNPIPCPLFHWTTRKVEIPMAVNVDIGEDGFCLSIGAVTNFEDILHKFIGYTISIFYNLSIPIEAPIEGKTNAIKITKENISALYFNFMVKHEVPRKKSFVKSLLRKKITFKLVLHRGFLSRDEILGIVYMNLQSLIESSRCGDEQLAIVHAETGKAIGGCLSSNVRIRYPYNGAKTISGQQKVLEIGPWETTPSISILNQQLVDITITSSDLSAIKTSKINIESTQFDILSTQEKNDPLHLDWYVSNDVMEKEIENLTSQLENVVTISDQTNEEEEEEKRVDIKLRLDMMTVKLTILVNKVQREELTFEAYLDIVKSRVMRDKVLALYCSSQGMTAEALAVMRRVLIMEKELSTATT